MHFVAHENIRRHWARTDCQPVPTNCDDFQGENARYLPSTTFSDRLTLFAGGPDQIDLYHFGRGHTDGDTFVVFKAARTMHTGDMFLGKLLPFIDAENGNGGSALEFGPHADEGDRRRARRRHHHHRPLEHAAGVERPRGIPGGFYLDLVDRAKRGIDAGLGADEVAAAYVTPDRYSDYTAAPGYVEMIVRYVYEGR